MGRTPNTARSTDKQSTKKDAHGGERRRRITDSLLSPQHQTQQNKQIPQSALASDQWDRSSKMGKEWQCKSKRSMDRPNDKNTVTEISSYQSPSQQVESTSPYAQSTPNGTTNMSKKLQSGTKQNFVSQGIQCEDKSHEMVKLATSRIGSLISKNYDENFVVPEITNRDHDDVLKMYRLLEHLENCIWNASQKHTNEVKEAREYSNEELKRTQALLQEQTTRNDAMEKEVNNVHKEMDEIRQQLEEAQKRESDIREKNQSTLAKLRRFEERLKHWNDTEFLEAEQQQEEVEVHSAVVQSAENLSPSSNSFKSVSLDSPERAIEPPVTVENLRTRIVEEDVHSINCYPYPPTNEGTAQAPQKLSKIRSKFQAAKNQMRFGTSRKKELVREQLSAAQWTIYGLFSQLNQACNDKDWMHRRLEESKQAEKTANDSLKRLRTAQAELRARLSSVTKSLHDVAEERDEGWRKVAEVLEQGQKIMKRLETTMNERSILYKELCNCHSATQRLCETLQFSGSASDIPTENASNHDGQADSPSESSTCVQIARGVSQRMQDLRDTLVTSCQSDNKVAEVWSKESDIVRNGLEAVCDAALQQKLEQAEKEAQDANENAEALSTELNEANLSISKLQKTIDEKQASLDATISENHRLEENLADVQKSYASINQGLSNVNYKSLQCSSEKASDTRITEFDSEQELRDWWCMSYDVFSTTLSLQRETYSAGSNTNFDPMKYSSRPATKSFLRRQWYLAAVAGHVIQSPSKRRNHLNNRLDYFPDERMSTQNDQTNLCSRHYPITSPTNSVQQKTYDDVDEDSHEETSAEFLYDLFASVKNENQFLLGSTTSNEDHERQIFERAVQDLHDM